MGRLKCLFFRYVLLNGPLGTQIFKKSVLIIEHLQLHFNIFFLYDVFDLTELS